MAFIGSGSFQSLWGQGPSCHEELRLGMVGQPQRFKELLAFRGRVLQILTYRISEGLWRLMPGAFFVIL
jgi:hypothetical protein